MEHGATRNFEAEKLIDQEEKRLQAQREEDESNPMKVSDDQNVGMCFRLAELCCSPLRSKSHVIQC